MDSFYQSNMHNAENSRLDYLVIGHITEDIVDGGFINGGTASYSSLTARAFGLTVGVVTAGSSDMTHLPALDGIAVHQKRSAATTTFKNIDSPSGRKQYLLKSADVLTSTDVPVEWLSSRILHFGPVAQEADPSIIEQFPDAFIGITPQGWMRARDEQGMVRFSKWDPALDFLNRVEAAVISIEDVQADEEVITDLAKKLDVLVVTEGYNGARVYWHADVRRFSAPSVEMVDPTGAGDIFAAIFFIRLQATRDPWESARLAVELASLSVSRKGLDSIPTELEIRTAMVDILKGP